MCLRVQPCHMMVIHHRPQRKEYATVTIEHPYRICALPVIKVRVAIGDKDVDGDFYFPVDGHQEEGACAYNHNLCGAILTNMHSHCYRITIHNQPANFRRAPGSDRGVLWCWSRKLIRILGVSRANVDDHLFFFVGGLLREVACCAHGRRSVPKVSDVSRYPVDLHCLVRNNASHGAFLVSGVTSGYGRPHPYRVADSEPSVLFFRFFCCSVHIPHPNGVCVHDVSRGCPRVAAVSRRNVVQVHRLFHRAILSRSDDLHASMASLRYAIAGRSVGTSVPHSDSPPGDELQHRLQLLSDVRTAMNSQASPDSKPRRSAVDEGQVRSASDMGDVHSNPLPYLLNLETSSFPLSRRRIQRLAWLTAADHLSHLALGYRRIRPPCEVQHPQSPYRRAPVWPRVDSSALLHADFTRSTSSSNPNSSTSDSIMPTLLRISISPDAFVFSLAFPERPSDTHRCTVAESVINRILLICQLNAHIENHTADADVCSQKLREWRRQGVNVALIDLKKAYLQIRIDKSLWPYQTVVFNGKRYCLTRLGFGLNVAPLVMKAVLNCASL
ncbi:hypothetical protein T03_7126 [Trichinella britovi]|uniref:Reverse transcriptase domain-containing protein n=1 Tax=Trichinella britovi TaxID=45882 RepID=A0A0V1CBW8_TRIBR|nr:hypothetical protein T03_7126 [Trichinella britovi]